LPRHRFGSRIALVCAAGLALAAAGCGNKAQLFQDNNEGGWFSKPMDVFAKPDWARPTGDNKAADECEQEDDPVDVLTIELQAHGPARGDKDRGTKEKRVRKAGGLLHGDRDRLAS